jgi:protein-L-isoaspartate(D-aspartate) O-methyltransferase
VSEPPPFEVQRREMVEAQLRARGIRDPRILDAMGRVPREEFVPHDAEHLAYADHPVPVGGGQTISQPYVVALTLEAAKLGSEDVVLDVGTGTGYAAAVAALVVKRVWSIERDPALAAAAAERLRRLGYANVRVAVGDGSRGWPAHAPFRAIVAGAAAADVPAAWVRQVVNGGRIVAPLGPADVQHLVRLTKSAMGIVREKLTSVRYVPLVAAEEAQELVELP